jgi:hypothetical protein
MKQRKQWSKPFLFIMGLCLICIIFFSGAGDGRQSGDEILTSAIEEKTDIHDPPWFPYMEIGGSKPGPLYGGSHYITIMDTIKAIPPPDSVMITVTTFRGDHERFWLAKFSLSDYPGKMAYGAFIPSACSRISIPDDGVLQVDDTRPDYHKVSYRSYNDHRVYSLRLEWFRPDRPGVFQ